MRAPHPLAAALLLLILPALWWWPLLVGYLPDFMDTVTLLYPYRVAVSHQVTEGAIPLWNPYVGAGGPLAANPQVAVWYPLNWPFFLWPGPIMNGLTVLVHYWIGGLGLWMLARRTGALGWAALFGAIGFQFGSMLISRIALPPHLYTTVWVPWMLLAIERSIGRGNEARDAAFVGGLFGIQLLAGAPQVSYYTAILLPLWWIARSWLTGRPLGSALRAGILAALIGGLLAGIQLIPTIEFLRESARTAIAPERLAGQGLNGSSIWRAFVGWTADPIEDTDTINAIGLGFLMILPFAFAGVRRRRLSIVIVVAGALFFVLALGALVPFFSRILPLYGSFHAPRRSLLMWSILGPLMAAHGAQAVAVWLRTRQRSNWLLPVLLCLLAANTWILPRLERAFTTPDRLMPPAELVEALGTQRFITLDPTFAYSHGSRAETFYASLVANLAAWHRLYGANVYDPLVPRRMALLRYAAATRSGLFYPSHGIRYSDPGSPLLGLLDVQFVIGDWRLYDPGLVIPGASIDHELLARELELVIDDPIWPLWRFREERPLAWVVEIIAPVVDAADAIWMASHQDTRRIAFTEEPIYLPIPRSVPTVIASHQPGARIRVEFPEPTSENLFVCVASAWMPGWVARSDNHVLHPVLPTNGAIMGVWVPEGTTTITLYYEPSSFRHGFLMTLVGLLILILSLTAPRACRARRGLSRKIDI